MGIKNFHKFLRKHCPHLYKETPLSELRHRTIAIDMNIYLYKYKGTHKERWLNMLLSLLLLLKKHQIKCVCIYDTKAPMEKNARKAERKQRRKNAEDKIVEIQDALHLYHTQGTILPILLEISSKKEGKLKKILNVQKEFVDESMIYQEIQLLSNQTINITRQDISVSKKLVELLGIPYYDAEGEAESLCSYLCCHGQVDAVLSDDTDVLVYGTPLFITKLNTRTESCVFLRLHEIIQALDISFDQFVDLCIMSGTDYNDNMPNIGNEKAFNLLKKFISLEHIEQQRADLPVDSLNYRRVREIFYIPPTLPHYTVKNSDPLLSQLHEFAQSNRIFLNSSQLKLLL